MPSSSRRAFLAACAALSAGCLDRSSGGDGDSTPDTIGSPTPSDRRTTSGERTSPGPPSETPSTTPDEETPPPNPTVDADAHTVTLGETVDGVTVANTRLQVAVVTYGTHSDVRYVDGGQFLIVRVSSEAKSVRGLRLGAVTGASARLSDARRLNRRELSPTESDVAFPLPVAETDSAAVVWHRPDERDVRWELPDDVVADLADAPDFEVRSFEVPDVAKDGEVIEATVEVVNVGDQDGTFIAELGSAAISDQGEVSVEVPAGETVALTSNVDADFGESDELTVVLRWRETVRRTVKRQ